MCSDVKRSFDFSTDHPRQAVGQSHDSNMSLVEHFVDLLTGGKKNVDDRIPRKVSKSMSPL